MNQWLLLSAFAGRVSLSARRPWVKSGAADWRRTEQSLEAPMQHMGIVVGFSQDSPIQVKEAKVTEIQINEARENYRPAAERASLLYFILNNLNQINSYLPVFPEEMSKVCAIFGGSRGIGQAVAQLLAQKGYCLAVIARNLDRAQATVDRLGAGHLALSCDITKEEAIQKTFKEIENKLGHISYLVNAAGINSDGLLLRTKSEDMISQLQTNLLGTMLTCKTAVKSMIQHKGGAIVNVGSIVGLRGGAGQSAYSASKAGLVGFSRSFAKEVARKNIQVNMVAPGFIHTDMTAHLKEEELKKTIPLGRFGQPQEVAQSIAFLLETPYVTGLVLVVDGGLQLLI